jgi:hypothetical protein
MLGSNSAAGAARFGFMAARYHGLPSGGRPCLLRALPQPVLAVCTEGNPSGIDLLTRGSLAFASVLR